MLANTQIRINNGYLQFINEMDRIEQGYKIISYDFARQQQTFAYTKGAKYRGKYPVIEITLSTGEKVTCTGTQLFFTPEGKPIAAKSIEPGAKLASVFGASMTVKDISLTKEMVVYSLQVYNGENFVLCSGGLITKNS